MVNTLTHRLKNNTILAEHVSCCMFDALEAVEVFILYRIKYSARCYRKKIVYQ